MNEHVRPQSLRHLPQAEALAWLEAEVERTKDQTSKAPGHGALPVAAIEVAENLFQPRAVAEWHLSGLLAAVKAKRTLPPLLVYRVGLRTFLLDGHHRLEAYRRVRIADAVPVQFFWGTPAEAVLAARKANSEPKLPMSVKERHDDAWRLVKLGRHSKADIHEAANVSVGSVAEMRKALRALGAQEVEQCRTWREAREKARGKADWTAMGEDERQARLDALAEMWTGRLGKAFGTKLSDNPEVAANALAGYFGRRLPEIVRHLKAHVGDFGIDNEDEEADF